MHAYFYISERNLKETTDDKNLSFTKTRNSESSSRQSATSARLSTSELTVNESESDRLSLSEDEDLFAEEAENKSQRKDKRASSKQSNSYLHRASKYEEEILKSVKLTPDQIREIKEAFHVFDNNGDGCITATELKKLVTSLGYNITEAELMDMMNQIGKVKYEGCASSLSLSSKNALSNLVHILGTKKVHNILK